MRRRRWLREVLVAKHRWASASAASAETRFCSAISFSGGGVLQVQFA